MNNVTTGGVIYKQMMAVMKDIGSVSKGQKNEAQGFKFRGVDQFINALNPALLKNGVIMVPKLVTKGSQTRDLGNGKSESHVHLEMTYTFYAEDGSNLVVGPIPSEGLDRGDKATNKALSAALKYALIQTFSITTEDVVDGDSESLEITSPTGNNVKGNGIGNGAVVGGTDNVVPIVAIPTVGTKAVNPFEGW